MKRKLKLLTTTPSRIIALLIVTIFYAILISVAPGSAESPVTWLDSSKNPSLYKNNSIDKTSYDSLLEKRRGFVHQECIKKKVAVSRMPLHYYRGCWYVTDIGLLEKDGKYLLQPGTEIAGRIKGNSRDTSSLHPSPNPKVFLELIDDEATGYGFFVTLRNYDTTIFDQQTSAITGSVTLTYQKPGTRLQRSNSSIHIDEADVWYSGNAQWMVVWNDKGTVTRISLSTFKALQVTVREKPKYGRLTGAADITNDGRYIAIAVTNPSYDELYLEDLATCEEAEEFVIKNPINCSERTLKPYLESKINPYELVSLPRFYGNDAISVYHTNTDATYTQYTLQAPNTTAQLSDYIALGDSFASGEGAFDYEDGTDVDSDDGNKCHLSKLSYPYLINQQLALSSFRSVACSGAKIENVVGGENRNNQFERPEFMAGELHPGDHRQIWHVDNFSPNIITISMSGNDIGFGDKVRYCVMEPDSCFNTYEDRLEIMQEINGKFDKLTDMYRQLKEASTPNAKIYIIGYPQIINPDLFAKCGVNVHLSMEEREFAFDLTAYFNKVIKSAADNVGVSYIGIEGSLTGSRLCETSSAAVAVNGVTVGNDSGFIGIRFLGQESFHPNASGHVLIKNAILEHTDSFTKVTPTPTPTAVPPSEENQMLLKLVKHSGRPINKLNYDNDPKNNVLYRGKVWQATIDAVKYQLSPFSSYKVILNSAPTDLGSYATDLNGNLKLNIPIPADTVTGMHTLHIYGQNEQGEHIDIYRYVYVAASKEDADGNGVLDDTEPCAGVQALGVDSDADGIDDACDGVIGETQTNQPKEDIQNPETSTSYPPSEEAPHQPQVTGGVQNFYKNQPSQILAYTLVSTVLNQGQSHGIPLPDSTTQKTLGTVIEIQNKVPIAPMQYKRKAISSNHKYSVVSLVSILVACTMIMILSYMIYAKKKATV